MQKELNLIVKGAAFMSAGIIASKILGFFFNIFLARILTPSELGLFYIATAVIGFFVMLATFGMADSLTRFVAFYMEKNEPGRVKGTILSVLKIHLFLSIAIGLIVFFFADIIAGSFFSKPEIAPLLQILAITLPFSTLATDFLSATDGFKKIQYKILVRRVIQIVFRIACIVTLFLLGFTLIGAIITFVLAEIVAFFFGFFFLEKKTFSFIGKNPKPVSMYLEIIKFSLPVLLMGIFSYFLSVCDVILLGFFAPSYSTGIYGTAVDTAKLGLMPWEILLALGVPIATGYIALKKFDEFRKVYGVLSRWLFSAVLPFSIFLALFAEPIQIFLFGQAYANSATAMTILLAGYLVFSITGPSQQYLLAAGKTKLNFFNAAVSGIIALALDMILIPVFMQSNSAQLGAAIATAISYAVWGILGLIELNIIYKIQPFTKRHINVFAAAIVSISIAYFGTGFFLQKSIFSAIATGIIGLALYAGFFLVFKCFEKEDIQVFLAIEKKTGIKIGFLRKIAKRFI